MGTDVKKKVPRYKTVLLGERKIQLVRMHKGFYTAGIDEGGLVLYENDKEDKPEHLFEAEFTTKACVFEGKGPTLKKAMDALNKDMLETVHTIGALMGYEFED